MARLPLAGVRVLELGNYSAAPTAGRLLADFGAEVVKVERPGTGDELRRWRLHGGDTSVLYRTINRNKLSVVLDLSSDAGRDAVVELARTSDVLMENFRPGTLERWGIGPDRLTGVNPDLIVARISAFGQTGPLSQKPGFAAVAEAFGGLRALVGEQDRPPSRVGVSIGDSIAGLYAAFGVVMRLFERSRTPGLPPSSPVDVALHEAVFSMMESLVPDYSAFGVERDRVGGRMEGIGPSNAYRCADGGSVIIAGNGDSIFLRLMDVIERPDLGADPALGENAGRWARRDELDDAIGDWTATVSAEEALKRLDDAGVPAARPFTAEDITREEQYQARGMIQRFDVSTGAEVLHDVAFPGVVPVLDGISVPVRCLGPDLGQHTDKVLIRAGLSAEQIAAATGGDRRDEGAAMTFTLDRLRDVTLRDGLQLTGKLLDTDVKVALVRRLFALGIQELEIGSMARPDLLPPIANTLDVVARLTPEELEHCWVWVATPRQVTRGQKAGVTRFQFCVSVSEAHNQANVNRSVDASLDGLAEAVSIATTAGHRVQVALATSFTCPFEGAVDPDRVLTIAADERLAGISDLMVCDTIGQAVPAQVEALIGVVRQELAETTRVAFHGHDTWGLGVANSLAAFDAGAAFVDGTLGALGGCPFAPGASGNTSLEDLLFATQAVSAETFHQLIEVSEELLAQLGEPNRSRAVDGARETESPFPWAPSAAAQLA